MKKLLLTVVAAVTIVTAVSPAAYAGNGISFGIEIVEPRHDYDRAAEWDDDEDQYEDERITCREGRRIVRSQGYREIEPQKCEGNTYRYRAIRRGKVWLVRVDAWSGQIVSTRRMKHY